jgi:hypothetical protein
VALITVNAGATRQITYAASGGDLRPTGTFVIANLDQSQTVYIGPADNVRQQPDLSADQARDQLLALQSITVSSQLNWFAYNPGSAAVVIDVITDADYWAPSPAQILSQGVPPAVVNVQTKSEQFKGAGTFTFVTLPSAGRVWHASLSGTFSSNAGYGGGTDNEDAIIQTGSGTTLCIIELVIPAAANQFSFQQSDVSWPGIAVASGDTLQMVVSSPNSGTVIRVSGFVAYSVP